MVSVRTVRLRVPHYFEASMMNRSYDCRMSSVDLECTQCPRPEWHVGRHGRKAWLKDVAERRGLGVAGKRGRKAWLKGVVLRRVCRIEDVVLNTVGLPE